MFTRRTRNILLSLCLLAFALRLGIVVKFKAWKHPEAIEHRAIARFLVEGKGFSFIDFDRFGPTSFQSPPYPFLLAALFKVFGVDAPAAYVAAMVINCLVGALVVPLTFMLARAMRASESVALLAAAAVAVWPTQLYACTVAQAIVLITACVTAVMGLFYVGVRSGRAGPWVAFSVLGAFAALTEPAFLPPLACTGVLVLLWPTLSGRQRLRNAAILLGITILILGPWSIRNRMVHGIWVPVKSSFWVNTWKANNDYASGSDRLPMTPALRERVESTLTATDDTAIREEKLDGPHAYVILTPQQRARLHDQPEVQRERVFKEITVNWIRSHPRQYLRLCAVRLGKTIWIDWDNPKSYKLVYLVSRAALLLTAAIGLVLALRRRWSLLVPALFYFATLALYTLTITAARFAIPFEPLMLCFSALAIVAGWRTIAGRSDATDEMKNVFATDEHR
jgi:hypothetical protein